MAGRPPAPEHVVNVVDILNDNAILKEDWNLMELCREFVDNQSVLRWLARHRLIANAKVCPRCQINCSLTRDVTHLLGFRWTCRVCHWKLSVLHNSFFSRGHIPVSTMIYLLYCWSADIPQNVTKHELRIHSRQTIIDWFNFCREICERVIARNRIELGGFDDNGESVVVEIDESKYFHRKYHRGNWREGHWVFGAIERQSGKCFLTEVAARDANTLLPLIEEHILPGSRIISDGWGAYGNVATINGGVYAHDVVIHERNFVDPKDADIHTQNIENMWMRAKRKLKRQFGTHRHLFQSYLSEFQWRSHNKENTFEHFIVSITTLYPF